MTVHEDCLDLYNQSDDPWGNRSRGIYKRVLKDTVIKLYQYLNLDTVNLVDIGCGGGNVLDVFIENKPDPVALNIVGMDFSPDTIRFLKGQYPNDKFIIYDITRYPDDLIENPLVTANIVSMVDTIYYWGQYDPSYNYRSTLDKIWDSLRVGTLVLVSDCLIRFNYRDYLKGKDNCELLESYTYYGEPTVIGGKPNKYQKIRIYRKS